MSDVRRRLAGCVGLGALGIGGTAIAVAVVIGAITTQLEGCDLQLGSAVDPGRGRSSQRVDVLVAPATGLSPGNEVVVGSGAFGPNTIVGIAVCLEEAATERRGVEACDEAQGARYATSPDGELRATYRVPRTIFVGGTSHDCGARAGRCVLVAADANDYDRSGGQPLTFDATTPAPTIDRPGVRPQSLQLPIAASETGPLAAGSAVELTASGFQPGEPLLAAWCTDRFLANGPFACEPVDPSAAFTAVALRTLPDPQDDGLRADAQGQVVVTMEVRRWIRSGLDTLGEDRSTAASTTVPDDAVDCRGDAGRCSFVIAAAADTARSAVLPYELAGR